jgi:hypothetical protein
VKRPSAAKRARLLPCPACRPRKNEKTPTAGFAKALQAAWRGYWLIKNHDRRLALSNAKNETTEISSAVKQKFSFGKFHLVKKNTNEKLFKFFYQLKK